MKMNSLVKHIILILVLLMGITLQAQAKNAMHIVINNHLGAPEMLIDENQQVVWQAEYDEFGQATILVEEVEFNHRFPGQYYDKETGLSYNYYRDYDPSLGRYVQSDPIGLEAGVNTYAYVSGNPISKTDPLGLLEQCVTGISTTGGKKIGPFKHSYHCWTNIEGERVCKGYSFDEGNDPGLVGKVFGETPGSVLPDEASNEAGAADGQTQCTEDDKNQCMDTCAAAMWELEASQPSKYGLMRAETCNGVVDEIYEHCKSVCP